VARGKREDLAPLLFVAPLLFELVAEVIDLYHKDGKPLPAATAGHDLANRLQDVA
jgi:hypothetical protein